MGKYIDELIVRYPILTPIKKDIENSYEIIKNTYKNNGRLLVGGNGGSAADSEHIVGELMKGFVSRRKISKDFSINLKNIDYKLGEELANSLQDSLEAIAITGHIGLSSAFANDVDPNMIYAQQVHGYGRKGDVLLAISTSGNAKNLLYAVITAKAKGMKIILLSGKDGGIIRQYADVSIIAPLKETYKIQELHLPIYHALCLELESYFYETL